MSLPQSFQVDENQTYKDFEEFQQYKLMQRMQENTYNTTTNNTTTNNTTSSSYKSKAQARGAFKMQDIIAMTPTAVCDSQVVLNKKILGLIDENFTDTSYNDSLGNKIKTANFLTYSQDVSGEQTIQIPTLTLVNIPSFSFSSLNFNVSLEDRGFDSSKNILVSPTLVNSKFSTYNINGQMIDRGEPVGLTRLRALLSDSITEKALVPPKPNNWTDGNYKY